MGEFPAEGIGKMKIFHLDFNYVKRRSGWVRNLLATVAGLGYDAILWELEDQVRWETCPECADADSWSKDEFRELLAFSRKLGLEPIPLLQTVGHGEYVMKLERYFPFREDPRFNDCYCTSSREVRSFLKRWIREYCELFGDLRHFHLGGDEAYRFGSCPACSVRERGELYAEHISELAGVLAPLGIRPGIWGDMVLAFPESLKALPRETVVWDWKYMTGDNASFDSADLLSGKGFDVVLCSAARSSQDGPFTPNIRVHFPNIAGIARKVCGSRLLSHCVTNWSLRLNPIRAGLPLLELPRRIEINPDISLAELEESVSIQYFGIPGGMEAARLISLCDNRVRIFSGIQWNGLKDSAFPPSGYLRRWIQEWGCTKEPFWSGRDEMFEAMRASTLRGISMLGNCSDSFPVAALWLCAGSFQLEYLDLLQTILSHPNPGQVSGLETFQKKCETFFCLEETESSAKKNASLLLSPLFDFLSQGL